MKGMICIFLTLLHLSVVAVAECQEDSLNIYVLNAWNNYQLPGKNETESILAYRNKITKYVKRHDSKNEKAILENACQALIRVADLCKKENTIIPKPASLKKILHDVDLKSEEIVKHKRLNQIVEDYYGLKFIMEGAPVKLAWGSMWFNTTVETIGNEYDYQRYKRVFELNNPSLTLAYMFCLKSVFRYNGYTKGLEELRPFFDKYMPEGKLKKEIEGLYDEYYHLREGAEAPLFVLKDFKGREYSLMDYRGKVLVVDVWATWCGGCIAKLPKYLEMKQKYEGRDDIEFITISIDDKGAYNNWKYALPRLKLMSVTNLLAAKGECTFQDDYNITGIPRYFLIDKKGKIVSVYAPTPGNTFEIMIDKTLNDN
ncbi:MAG: redoxin family protein [Bacteroidales bacterium]|nr:redoxin family protein [Bacteroidales bacterium]